MAESRIRISSCPHRRQCPHRLGCLEAVSRGAAHRNMRRSPCPMRLTFQSQPVGKARLAERGCLWLIVGKILNSTPTCGKYNPTETLRLKSEYLKLFMIYFLPVCLYSWERRKIPRIFFVHPPCSSFIALLLSSN